MAPANGPVRGGRPAGAGAAVVVDLPDAPRPDPDVPAPLRLLLSHADRSRFHRGSEPSSRWRRSGRSGPACCTTGSCAASGVSSGPAIALALDATAATAAELARLLAPDDGTDIRLRRID